jgi:hypothetical protein
MNKEKQIPTIVGLVLLLTTLYFGNFLVNKQTNTFTQANGNCQPINPQITNITNNSAAVSFITSNECLSTISLLNRTIEDIKSKNKIHYFDINSLEDSKVYTFSIISGGEKFSSDNFNFKTAQKPSNQIPDSNLAWGKVYNQDQTLATDAIVYFSVPSASSLSALVTSGGDWNIPLATSFNESLTDYFSLPVNTEENIIVIDNKQTQTQIISNTNHNNPVPDIIIGQNNFSAPSPIVELPQTSLLEQEYNFSDNTSLTISNPSDNETLSTKRPEFFGTAKPGSELKIEVHSPTAIDDSITTDKDGTWNWSVSQDLSPGEHTVTLTDENNNTISKKFIVLAAESNTSFTASASAITPTSTPTPTRTPTPTGIPTSIPSTSSGIPKTGNTFPTGIILVISLISLSSAFIFYKKY